VDGGIKHTCEVSPAAKLDTPSHCVLLLVWDVVPWPLDVKFTMISTTVFVKHNFCNLWSTWENHIMLLKIYIHCPIHRYGDLHKKALTCLSQP